MAGSRLSYLKSGCLYLVSLYLLLSSLPIYAQSKKSATLTGLVYDGQLKENMVAAGVKLLQPKDSTLIKGALTDQNGRFRIGTVKGGKYLLEISYVGYETHYEVVKVADGEDKSIGTVTMIPSATALKEVQVVGNATPVVMKTDTVQFNTEAFKTRENASVEELLRKIPGMEVDDDGNITYNGEAIERIELDGRDFFSSDPKMATRNLPSNMIQNLQVVDKKSEQARLTGMDDGERVKVLNLNVKADKKHGLLANLTGGYGTRDRYNAQANVNYFNGDARYTLLGNLNNIDGVRRGRGDRTTRTIGLNYDNKIGEKLLITAEAGYQDSGNSVVGDRNTESLLGSEGSTLEYQQYNEFSNSKRVDGRSRIEWNPTNRTSFIAEPTINWSRNSSRNQDNFSTKDDEGTVINSGKSLQTSESDGLSASLGLHLRHTFNDMGRNIYVRAEGSYQGDKGSGFKNSTTDFGALSTNEVIDQMTTSDNLTWGYGLRASYLEPFSKIWALQFNYRFDAQNRENNQLAYNKDNDGLYSLLDTRYSRSSTNTNFVQRMGLQLRYSFWKNSNIYAGFEASPNTTHTITSNGQEVTFDKSRTVWNYAPTFSVDIRPSDTLRLMVRYSARTSQPSMMQLNDAPIINSPLSTTIGNPDLLPSFAHTVRANINFNRRAQRQSFGLFGMASLTNDAIITRSSIDRSTGITETSYENVNDVRQMWFGFSVNTPIGGANSKWTSFTFGNLSYNRHKAYVNDLLNTSDAFSPRFAQRFTWSGDNLQVTTGGFLSVQDSKNSASTDLDRTTFDYNIFNEVVWTLPFDLTLSSKVTYQDASGYNDNFNRKLWLWDASLSYAFLSDKRATVELSGYDLLRQRTTYTRNITANSIVDQNVSGITNYFMLTFTYRFNSFGGGVAPEVGDGGIRRPGGFGRVRRGRW